MVMIQGESLDLRARRPLDEEGDEALLARLRAGDETAFRALVDRHRPWLVRLCTRLLGQDAHAAEDAAQESLLKLHRAAREGRPLRVRPWLTVVARNTCIDEQRRRRPDLPGVLPERAVALDDPFQLDAALTEAWSQLSGRHREVLYLREVLGFSYKEIGAVMDLTMPATETLVFRARAALRREYERSGGTSFGSGLLGFHLARLGLGRRKDNPVADGVSNAAVGDSFNGITGRLAHFLCTSLPAGGEQAVAKVLSVAAGVFMAAGAMLPGLVPFADAPAAGAAAAPPVVTQAVAAAGGAPEGTPMSLKSLLGNAAPSDWTPQRSHTESRPAMPAASPAAQPEAGAHRITPLRDAAALVRPSDASTLNRPGGGDSGEGPLRSLLPDRPERPARAERPHPLRSLLADPLPLPIDPLPLDEPPLEAAPAEPAPSGPTILPTPAEPAPATPEVEHPSIRETVEPAEDAVPTGDGNVVGHDADLLRRRDR